jgi:deazaflavin-dependent oxidoreductase (nitroreductase family)
MNGWVKAFTGLNVFFYRLTGGMLGSEMGGQSMLLLSTTGRKSGKNHVIAISYFRDGGNYILVASNWGRDHHPAWYHNLISQPAAEIQVKTRKLRVSAHLAAGEEYERLWKYVNTKNPVYTRYQRHTVRKIPIVILEPEP